MHEMKSDQLGFLVGKVAATVLFLG